MSPTWGLPRTGIPPCRRHGDAVTPRLARAGRVGRWGGAAGGGGGRPVGRARRAGRRPGRTRPAAPRFGNRSRARLKFSSVTGKRRGRADVAQLVAHHLAKVRVAGSNPVVRSDLPPRMSGATSVEWPRGEATACKAVYTGSNPVSTSQLTRAIGAVGARFLDTEEVTGSNPVSPTTGNGPAPHRCRAVSPSGVVLAVAPHSSGAPPGVRTRRRQRRAGHQKAVAGTGPCRPRTVQLRRPGGELPTAAGRRPGAPRRGGTRPARWW